ncbi:MAG: zinc ribbon domain-containing protein [Prevotella sp.]|nr:zinc ribbon domain-containing protein [Prevotella sp.]
MPMSRKSVFSLLVLVLLLTGCYHRQPTTERYYGENFNFIVRADSLELITSQPEEEVSQMPTDTIVFYKNEQLVVVDFRIIPQDSIDSVWVHLAHDQFSFGWTRESTLLPSVDPDDPISQFISTFSNRHLLIFLIVISIIASVYLYKIISRKNAHIVHFNDIDTPYPAALCLTVATSAALYASIQMFAPDMWRHFYFHPTLNPFAVVPLIGIFLATVWLIVIVGLATVDEVRKRLPFGEAVLYLFGVGAVCAALYIVFSVTTLYYVGYPLLAIYWLWAIRRFTHGGKAHP